MDKKTVGILSGIILLVCFFLPYLKADYYQVSGYDIVFGPRGTTGSAIRYVWLLIPISAILLLFGAIKNKYLIGRKTLNLIPLLTLIYFIIRTYTTIKSNDIAGTVGLGEFFQMIGYGLWITLVTSVLLVFGKAK